MPNYIAALFTLFLYSISTPSSCAVIWDWTIINPVNFTNPSDNVTIHATLYNDPASETLSELDINAPGEITDIGFFSGTSAPAIFDNYTYDEGEIGTGDIRSQFAGVVLEPGENFSFVLYTLLAIPGGAAAGSYEMSSNSMALFASSQGYIDRGPVSIHVVPLPASVVLLLSGLTVFMGFLPARKKVPKFRGQHTH